MTQYRMLSDSFLTRFRGFMAAENRNPAGAFDAMPKTQTRRESTMPKYRYVLLPNTGGQLYTRSRSADLAYDEAGKDPNEIANAILQFLSGKISDVDMRQVKEYLMIEAGEDPDSVKEAKQMAKASASRGAQDSSLSSFDRRFPSASRIGRDDMIGTR
jgi:hypothetical protein